MDIHLPSRLLRLVLLASLLAGCADQTSLMVEVTSSDLVVPDDVDELRFEVRSATGRSIDRRFSISGAWPHSLAVLPASSSDGAVVLTVTGLSGGAPVVRRVLETAFVSGLERRVEVRLERACLGVQCGEGVDCVAGVCGGGVSDGGVDGGMEIRDGGVDGGASDAGTDDAGAADGGRSDGGAMDGGSIDGGSIDGGHDGGRADDAGSTDGGGDTPLPCTSAACPIRISELATRGPASALDEFVELYNPSSSAYSLDGVELYYASSSGVASRRLPLTSAAIIAPRGFFLLAAEDFAGPTPDLSERWTQGFADAGGSVELRAGGERVDLIGWGTATVAEGSPITPAISSSAGTAGASYERKARASSTAASMASGGADATAGNGHDSGDNASDVVIRTTRQPQNGSSPAEP